MKIVLLLDTLIWLLNAAAWARAATQPDPGAQRRWVLPVMLALVSAAAAMLLIVGCLPNRGTGVPITAPVPSVLLIVFFLSGATLVTLLWNSGLGADCKEFAIARPHLTTFIAAAAITTCAAGAHALLRAASRAAAAYTRSVPQ
jgi:hypothetical protein